MKAKLPKKFYKKVSKDTKVISVTVKKLQFPNISRSIPEKIGIQTANSEQQTILTTTTIAESLGGLLGSRIFLFNFTLGFILMAISIVGYDLHRNMQTLQERQGARNAVVQEIAKWKNIVTEYKGYRDGYYQLALLSYRLENKKDAYEYINKAMSIDPGFVKGREFMQVLGE